MTLSVIWDAEVAGNHLLMVPVIWKLMMKATLMMRKPGYKEKNNVEQIMLIQESDE